MRVWTASLILVLCASDAAFAQTAAAADLRLRTVIMGIAGRRGVTDKDLTHALSDVVLSGYAVDNTRIVIGPEDLRRALDWEASRQESGCDSSGCMAEVGAALDAARIVSGTLDTVGDSYLLTLSEIDAKSLEPLARAQEEVPKNEADLVKATKRLTEQLMTKARNSSALVAATAFTGASGSIEFNTDPGGATILVGEQTVGTSPKRIENVAVGRHSVVIKRTDYETVKVDVPVAAGGVTKVDVELRIVRAVAERNLEVRQARWRDDNEWNSIVGWSKIVGGGVVGGVGVVVALGDNGNGVRLAGLTGALAGGAVVAWGVIDLINPPPTPVPEWELPRKLTVTPPKGAGEIEVRQIQEAPKATATR